MIKLIDILKEAVGTTKKPIEYEGKKYYYIGTVQYPQYEEGTSFSKV